jgi:hypothetical protein
MVPRNAARAAVLVACLLTATWCPAETPHLIFTRQEGVTNDIAERLVNEAYQSIGLDISVEVLPAERAIREADKGNFAGDIARIAGLSATYPNLIQVPEVLLTVEAGAFVRDPKIKLPDWNSLRPYRVGFRTGLKFAEAGTAGMAVETTTTDRNSFRKLAAGRLDVVLSGFWDGIMAIRQEGLAGIVPVRPPLVTVDLYHYVHVSHRDLVPALAKAIRELKAKGRDKAIEKEFFGSVGL